MEKKQNLKCILVDDDISFLTYLKILFQGNGFDVTACSSARESIEKLQNEDFDLIITDIEMPVNDGFDLISMIKKDEKTKDIPVVFLSNLDDISFIERAFKLGAVGYFKKPFLKQHMPTVSELMAGKNIGLVSLD